MITCNNTCIKMEGRKVETGINIDTILVNEIGQFGRYQMSVVLLSAIICAFSAFEKGGYIFTTGKINTRYLVPECEGENLTFYSAWIQYAIPQKSGGFEECKRFAAFNESNEYCSKELFDRSRIIPCDEIVYENKLTVSYDFDLGCSDWQRVLVGSIRIMGIFISLPVSGYLGDKYGRRFILTVNAFNTGWSGLLKLLAQNYEMFVMAKVLEVIVGGASFTIAYIMVTEVTGPKYRVISGIIMSISYALGHALLGFIAWCFQDWRTLILVLYSPMLLTFSYFWLMPESIRWLISKRKFQEAEKALTKIASYNNKSLSDESIQRLRKAKHIDETIQIAKLNLLSQIWKSPKLLTRCLTIPIWWITNALIYFGIANNSVTLNGNKYLNYSFVGLVEIPGYLMAYFVLDRFGRKKTLFSGYLISSISFVVFIIYDDHMIRLLMFLIAKCFISMVVTSTYIYTSELYPTYYRQTLLGISATIGRIGSMIAPLTPALATYWAGVPPALFTAFALTSAFLVLSAPETMNKNMPDSIQDAEDL